MMEGLYKLIELVKTLTTWWFFVEPWERAVRLRAGDRVKLCGPGVHFKVPFLDTVYVHNTRRMICSGPCMTVSSSDGKVFTLGVSASFCIEDVLLLHTTVHDPNAILAQRMAQVVSEFVCARHSNDVLPGPLKSALDGIDCSVFGLGSVEVCVNNFAQVSTYRLIQDSMVYWSDAGAIMSTTRKAP